MENQEKSIRLGWLGTVSELTHKAVKWLKNRGKSFIKFGYVILPVGAACCLWGPASAAVVLPGAAFTVYNWTPNKPKMLYGMLGVLMTCAIVASATKYGINFDSGILGHTFHQEIPLLEPNGFFPPARPPVVKQTLPLPPHPQKSLSI